MDTFLLVLDGVIYVAILFAIIEVYLKVNKIWKRKHEKQVAESQSLYGLSLSLFILLVWSVRYFVNGDYTSILDNMVYLVETAAMIVIGTGFFVKEKKGTGFLTLIKQALKLERKEASYLINTISGKKEAMDIVSILHQLAWIDDDLDENEYILIKDFAKNWNIEYSKENDSIPKVKNSFTDKLRALRKSVNKYLENDPSKEQAAQLQDLMDHLIKADEKTTGEEEIIFAEVRSILENYITGNNNDKHFHVLIVPQERSHEDLIRNLKPNAEEVHTAGGTAFSIEKYHSYKYADMMCEDYRKRGLFTIVFEM